MASDKDRYLHFVLDALANGRAVAEIDLDEHVSLRYHDDDDVRALCTALLKNKTVTLLNLSHNHLTHRGLPYISELLKVNYCIKYLDLSYNNVGEAIPELSDALLYNRGLTYLNLNHCQVDDTGGQAFASMLRGNQTLSEVRLQGNMIGTSGKMFAKAFHVNDTLQILDLADNHVEQVWLDEIDESSGLNNQPPVLKEAIPRLHSNDPTFVLADLSFTNDPTTRVQPIEDTGMRHLCVGLRENSCVQELRLNGNRIKIDSLRLLCQTIKGNPQCGLRTLALVENEPPLEWHHVQCVLDICNEHSRISALDLRNNQLGDEGAQLVLNHVTERSNLHSVQLAGNGISPSLIQKIDFILTCNPHPLGLKRMALQYMKGNLSETWHMGQPDSLNVVDGVQQYYGDGDVQFLCQRVLEKARQFHTLVLANNEITSKGVLYVAELLMNNESFTSLDISNNRIDDTGAELLIHVCKKRYTVLYLNVEGNPISSVHADTLRQMLIYNNTPIQVKQALISIDENTLENINLSGCECIKDVDVGFLVRSLRKNVSVKALYLDHNCITAVGMVMLCKLLEDDSKIQTLSLNNNLIDGGNENGLSTALKIMLISNHTLTTLQLNHNNFNNNDVDSIVESLSYNISLTKCSLEGNSAISFQRQVALQNAISLNSRIPFKKYLNRVTRNEPDLVFLPLSEMRLDDICVRVLAETMQSNSSVTHINLSNNNIGDMGAGHIAKILMAPGCPVQTLDLSRNGVTSDGCRMISDGLLTNTSLTALDLSDNNVSVNALKLFKHLFRSNNSLQQLRLEGNKLPSHSLLELECSNLNSQPLLKEPIRRMLANDRSVTSLAFAGTPEARSPLNDVGCIVLLNALSSNIHVTSLDLSYSAVTDAGIQHVQEILTTNNFIKTLKVTDCGLTDSAAALLAGALEHNVTLAHLGLARNAITDVGCHMFERVLAANDVVRALELEGNPISKEFLSVIDYSIQLNNESLLVKHSIPLLYSNQLAVLDLSNSPVKVTDNAIYLLCCVLQADNTSLTSINISGNAVTDKGIEYLAEIVEKNNQIVHLNISSNPISMGGASALHSALIINESITALLAHNTVGIPPVMEAKLLLLAELNKHPPAFKRVTLALHSQQATEVVSLPGNATARAVEKVQMYGLDVQSSHERLTCQSCTLLCLELQSNPIITTLILTNNYIGSHGASLLAACVRDHPKEYQTIMLGGNIIGDDGGCDLVAAIALPDCSVTVFDISNNCITDLTGLRLVRAMRDMPRLSGVLYAPNDHLTPPTAQQLLQHRKLNTCNAAFRQLALRIIDGDPTLKHLDLSNSVASGLLNGRNGLYDEGLFEFITGLLMSYKSSVKTITADSVGMSSETCKHFAYVLHQFNTCPVTTLNLSNNRIKDVVELSNAIKHNPNITSVDLSYNDITKQSAHALLQSTKNNSTLIQLDLTGNPIKDSTGTVIGLIFNKRNGNSIYEQFDYQLSKNAV